MPELSVERFVDVMAVDYQRALDIAGHVDFLKLDCEGGEYDILDDVIVYGEAVWKMPLTISVEFHRTDDTHILERLEEFYTIERIWNDGYVLERR